MKTMSVRKLALSILILGATACGSTGTEFRDDLRDQLLAREELWTENGSASYSVRIALACECADPFDVLLQIENGQVVGGEHVISGDPMTGAELAAAPTIPDLFAVVRDALDRDVPQVSVSYNPEFGFVRFLYIDYDNTSLSDDVEYTVDSYTPVTN